MILGGRGFGAQLVHLVSKARGLKENAPCLTLRSSTSTVAIRAGGQSLSTLGQAEDDDKDTQPGKHAAPR